MSPDGSSRSLATVGSLSFMSQTSARTSMYAHIAGFLRDSSSVLDIACGDGALIDYLNRLGHAARGVDGDPVNVSKAQAQGLPVRLGDAFRLADEAAVDAITLVHFVEHLTPEQLVELLGHCASLLRDEGRLVILTPNYADWTVASEIFWLDPTHVRPYPRALLEKMLRGIGMTILHSDTARLVDLGRRRQLLRVLGKLRFGREYERMNSVVVAQLQGR